MQAALFGSGVEVVRVKAPPPVRRHGRAVPPTLVADAVQALEHFNAQTGRRCSPFTGQGRPSESLNRIITAMLDWPAVRMEYRRMIDRCLADPWWDGPASTGCIFGPRVVEQSLARATERLAPSMRGSLPSGRAIANLLANRAG